MFSPSFVCFRKYFVEYFGTMCPTYFCFKGKVHLKLHRSRNLSHKMEILLFTQLELLHKIFPSPAAILDYLSARYPLSLTIEPTCSHLIIFLPNQHFETKYCTTESFLMRSKGSRILEENDIIFQIVKDF